MKKLLIIQIIILSCVISSYAQDEETSAINSTAITPFTGMDYVRIVFDKEKILSPSNTFKAVIKSIADNKILWQGSVTPSIAVNEGGKHVEFKIKN